MITYEMLDTKTQEITDNIMHTPATADYYELIMSYAETSDIEKVAELANLLPDGNYSKMNTLLYLFNNFNEFMEL